MVGSRRLMQLQAYLWYVVVVLYMDYNISSRKCAEINLKKVTTSQKKVYQVNWKFVGPKKNFQQCGKFFFFQFFWHKLLKYVLKDHKPLIFTGFGKNKFIKQYVAHSAMWTRGVVYPSRIYLFCIIKKFPQERKNTYFRHWNFDKKS